MDTPEHSLAAADRLLDEGDAAGALRHARTAQAAIALQSTTSPLILTALACRLIDCGDQLESLDPVREGLALLETHYERLSHNVHPASLQYDIGNAKKTIHDLEFKLNKKTYIPASISQLIEAKNNYWQAYRLRDAGQADPRLLVNLANVLDRSCRVAEALRWYEKALHIAPGFPMAHLNRGEALLFLERVSSNFTISLLAEARRSFRIAEASELPTHLRSMARERRIHLDKWLGDQGWSDVRIKGYEEQHSLESKQHDAYWQFCLDNFLSLSEHSLYCRCAGARRDDLTIPKSTGAISGDFVPKLELLLNRIKSEFCLARALFYQAIAEPSTWNLGSFEGTFSELNEDEAIGLRPEFLRTSFRLCFGVLDRIALGISELYNLAKPDEVIYFESFWRPTGQRRAGDEVRWETINKQRNRGLVALYSIATDLNRRNGQWGFFKEHRNHLEHGLLVLLDEGATEVPEIATPQRIALEQVPIETFKSHVLHMLQLTSSAIFSLVFCVREEGRRLLKDGTAVNLEIGKKGIGKQ